MMLLVLTASSETDSQSRIPLGPATPLRQVPSSALEPPLKVPESLALRAIYPWRVIPRKDCLLRALPLPYQAVLFKGSPRLCSSAPNTAFISSGL